jgi:hypothetical protein
MFRRVVPVAFALVAMLVFPGRASAQTTSRVRADHTALKGRVHEFYGSVQRGQWKRLYTMLSSDARSDFTEDEFVEFAKELNPRGNLRGWSITSIENLGTDEFDRPCARVTVRYDLNNAEDGNKNREQELIWALEQGTWVWSII